MKFVGFFLATLMSLENHASKVLQTSAKYGFLKVICFTFFFVLRVNAEAEPKDFYKGTHSLLIVV